MKKTLLIIGLVVLALGALGVGVAFAQDPQPPVNNGGYGWMHDYMEKALAAKLGLTEKQVEDQLAAGISMHQIALDNGITEDELAGFMNEMHEDAFTKAVADGAITQEQADWMLQRMQTRYQNGYATRNCPMHDGQGAQSRTAPRFGSGMMHNRGNGNGPAMMGGWGTQNP